MCISMIYCSNYKQAEISVKVDKIKKDITDLISDLQNDIKLLPLVSSIIDIFLLGSNSASVRTETRFCCVFDRTYFLQFLYSGTMAMRTIGKTKNNFLCSLG